MKSWPVQEAKARFSEFLDACLADGPQMVTRRGTETAVLVPVHVWQSAQTQAKPTLKALLLAPEARTSSLAPRRGGGRRRKIPFML